MSKGFVPIAVRSPATAQACCGLAFGGAAAGVALLACEGALSEKLLVTVGLDAVDGRRVPASRRSPGVGGRLDWDVRLAVSPVVWGLRRPDVRWAGGLLLLGWAAGAGPPAPG